MSKAISTLASRERNIRQFNLFKVFDTPFDHSSPGESTRGGFNASTSGTIDEVLARIGREPDGAATDSVRFGRITSLSILTRAAFE